MNDDNRLEPGLAGGTEPAEAPPDRRKLLLALAATAAAAAVVATPTKEGGAQLGHISRTLDDIFDSLGAIQSINQNILGEAIQQTAEAILMRQIMQAAFSLLAFAGIPPLFMQLIHCLVPGIGFGGFGIPSLCSLIQSVSGGENVMHRSDRVRPVMDSIWPAAPFEVIGTLPPDMDDHTRAQYSAIFEQVQAAGITLAATAEAQAELAAEDEITLAEINAAGAEGNLVTIVAKHAQLTATNSQRLAQIIAMMNAAFPVLANQPLTDHWRRMANIDDRERRREDLIDTPIVGPQPSGGGGGGGIGIFGDG